MSSNTQDVQVEATIANEEKKSLTGSLFLLAVPAFILILAIAAVIIGSFEYQFFSTWVCFVFMCAVPAQLVMGMVWKCSQPSFVTQLGQPAKGVVLLLTTAAIAAAVAVLTFSLVGQRIGPPTPMLIQYIIMTVIVTFWFVPVMNCWPLPRFISNPLLLGLGALLFVYIFSWILFVIFFDFSAMAGAPFYVESLDPKGLFSSGTALSFVVTITGAILILLLTDMTLLTKVTGKLEQPMMGIVGTLAVLAMTWACWYLFVQVLGVDKTTYFVKVPICFVFGVFLADTLMQHQLFAGMAQPKRGLLLTLLAAFYGFIMYFLYAAFGPLLTGVDLPAGAPTYDQELFVANALLSITFPVIVTVSDYFEFWPIKR